MIEHWLWLADRPRLGAIRAGELLARYGSAEAIYQTSDEALARAGVKPSVRAALADRDLSAAQKRFADCRAAGVRVLIPGDGEYPDRLRQQADAPVVLYAVGRMPDLEQAPCVGLVGARDADGRGLELARRLGWQIAGCGGTVVTGMARGIDAMSALGALDRGGPVIGVLGCGVDVVYPKENAAVLARVAESGCLVSEYPPGAAPLARRFPARNRIISALSDGLVVVQAAANRAATSLPCQAPPGIPAAGAAASCCETERCWRNAAGTSCANMNTATPQPSANTTADPLLRSFPLRQSGTVRSGPLPCRKSRPLRNEIRFPASKAGTSPV